MLINYKLQNTKFYTHSTARLNACTTHAYNVYIQQTTDTHTYTIHTTPQDRR